VFSGVIVPAGLDVTDMSVVNLPKKGNNLGHFAPFLPYRLAMHLDKQCRLM
jgi:hypothetical protein